MSAGASHTPGPCPSERDFASQSSSAPHHTCRGRRSPHLTALAQGGADHHDPSLAGHRATQGEEPGGHAWVPRDSTLGTEPPSGAAWWVPSAPALVPAPCLCDFKGQQRDHSPLPSAPRPASPNRSASRQHPSGRPRPSRAPRLTALRVTPAPRAPKSFRSSPSLTGIKWQTRAEWEEMTLNHHSKIPFQSLPGQQHLPLGTARRGDGGQSIMGPGGREKCCALPWSKPLRL